MASSSEIIAEWRDRLTTVPHASHDYVCKRCLGPVSNYQQCYGCLSLFVNQGVPEALHDAVVPMTSALSPSPWYSALVSYKGFEPRKGLVLVSVAHHFFQTHRLNIAGMLGGEPTIITTVPSKRGVSFDNHPLRIALGLAEPIKKLLRATLRFSEGSVLRRQEFDPNVFEAASTRVAGERIALVEDTWVTGATAISAAGKLLELGASSVGVFPIARCVNASYWPDDHPYRLAMTKPLDNSLAILWPR